MANPLLDAFYDKLLYNSEFLVGAEITVIWISYVAYIFNIALISLIKKLKNQKQRKRNLKALMQDKGLLLVVTEHTVVILQELSDRNEYGNYVWELNIDSVKRPIQNIALTDTIIRLQ